MKAYDSPRTKLSLILTAGELFSSKGYNGVTTREIAKKAGTHLGSIHYYFQTKEKLYIETFRYALAKGKRKTVQEILEKDPKKLDSEIGKAEVIWEIVQDFFQDAFSTRKPAWRIRLITQELYQPSSAMPRLVEEIFREMHKEIQKFYLQLKPSASEEEASIWAFFLPGIVTFYNHNQAILVEVLKKRTLDQAFVEKATKATAKMMILYLGLPLPKILDDKTKSV